MVLRCVVVLGFGMLASVAFAQDATVLESEKEKVSYALGVNFANQLLVQAVDVDPEMVSRGLKDALSHSATLLTEQEVRDVVAGLQKQIKARRAAFESEKMRVRTASSQASTPSLLVSFKMDPRLATGTYGAIDRWVSGPTYTRVGDGQTCTVETRVQGRDETGALKSLIAKWTSANPEMVKVTPSEGSEIKILVQRPGETSVRVTSEGVSKELAIKAAYRNNVRQVDIAPTCGGVGLVGRGGLVALGS